MFDSKLGSFHNEWSISKPTVLCKLKIQLEQSNSPRGAKSFGKFRNPDQGKKGRTYYKMALSSLAPSSLTGRALGVCAGIGAAAFLGYCIYFDHSRRYGIVLWFNWGYARPIRIRTVGLYLSTYWAKSVIMPTRLAMPVQHCQI